MTTICGTPQYISPEIISKKRYTNKTDLWAVGVIGFIVLFAQLPFDHQDNIHLYKMILKAEYDSSPEVKVTLILILFVGINPRTLTLVKFHSIFFGCHYLDVVTCF